MRSQGVYFTNHRRTVYVDIGEPERDAAERWVHRTREIIDAKSAPPPLVDDPRCGFCSHVGVCLPDENRAAPHARRITVSDPNGEVLHLTTPGSRASIRTGRVVVTKAREELASVPLERVVGLVVHGNIDVSSALTRELLWRGYSIVWCSGSGRVVGAARPSSGPNGLAQVGQHVASATGHLDFAREFIASKVANQATQLRRNSRHDVAADVGRLRDISRAVIKATDIPSILGFEGEAAAIYFGRISDLISPTADPGFIKRWPGRAGRGAHDPLNATLNYSYGMLLADTIRAVHTCGLDPHAGFLHSPSRNKPAFALDLLEQFRPTIADSAVLTAINNGELTTADFLTTFGDIRISPSARRILASAYQRRAAQQFTHPLFGYRLSWRRAIEVQARMVLAVLDGTSSTYSGIRTR